MSSRNENLLFLSMLFDRNVNALTDEQLERVRWTWDNEMYAHRRKACLSLIDDYEAANVS